MNKCLLIFLGCLILLSCRSKSGSDIRNVVLHNDNHIPDKRANEYFETGLQYVQRENYGKAKTYFEKADRICPNLPVILNAIGNCYCGMNFPDHGAPYFEHALKADSDFVKTYINYGNCLNGINDYAKAKEIFYLGLARNSPYAIDRHMLLINLARTYYFQRDKDKALQMLDSVTADTIHDQAYPVAVDMKKQLNTQ